MIYNFFVFSLWVDLWKAILPVHVQKDLSQRAVKRTHDFLINRKGDSKGQAEEWIYITVQEGIHSGFLHIVN
jgi:hypothetical protein